MPLRNHFHSPVNDKHFWDEVHGQWPGELVRHLTAVLPAGFRAAPRVHLGSGFEVNVGHFESDDREPSATSGGAGGTDPRRPRPHPDRRDRLGRPGRVRGPHLRHRAGADAGGGNRDRQPGEQGPAGHPRPVRHQGLRPAPAGRMRVGRRSGERAVGEPVRRAAGPAGRADPHLGSTPPPLYAVTLRRRTLPKGRTRLDAWFYPMAVGEPLPTLPVWLTPDLRAMLPLETSYQETCRILGIP